MLFSNIYDSKTVSLTNNIHISLKNEKLSVVNEYKYFGVLVDITLTFQPHVKYIKGLVTSRLYLLSKISHLDLWISHLDHVLLLYKTSILPTFDIGQLFYDCCNYSELSKLDSIQNGCLNVVYSRRQWPGHIAAQRNTNLLSLHSRRNLNLIAYSHKLSLNTSNLQPKRHLNTRSNAATLLKTLRPSTVKFGKSFLYRSIYSWNNLPETLKHIEDHKIFKIRLSKELKSNPEIFPTKDVIPPRS